MDSSLSATAWRIARYWAEGRDRSAVLVSGYARQVQDHLDHHGDPDHLRRVAGWMSIEHPTLHDLDLAMRYSACPRPRVVARAGHPCLCRGGSARAGGAPAPALLRQLIRRTPARAA